MVGFLTGIAQDDSDKLLSRIYNLQRLENRANWSSRVRDVLVKYGFEDTWESGPPPDKTCFIIKFKSVVWATEQAKIMSELDKGEGQVRFLSHLTEDPEKYKTPVYMKLLDADNQRVMSRFRLQTNKLAVVTGAWTGQPLANRLYTTCGVLEEEVHFLCECRRLSALRQRYLPDFVSSSPSTASAIDLMRSEDARELNSSSGRA